MEEKIEVIRILKKETSNNLEKMTMEENIMMTDKENIMF